MYYPVRVVTSTAPRRLCEPHSGVAIQESQTQAFLWDSGSPRRYAARDDVVEVAIQYEQKTLTLRQRVVLFDQRLHAGGQDVGVDFGGGNIGMA